MLRKLLAAACFALCVASSPAKAVDTATAVASCGGLSLTAGGTYGITQDLTGELCTNASGGGGGGLSVTDGATFTASSSSFTPSGGEYNSSPTTCASGKQCSVAITTQRAFTIDTPTTNNNLYAAITAAVPCLNATAATTNSYTNAQTNAANCDLHGNLYANLSAYMGTAGTANANVVSVQGIASMTPLLVTQSANADPCSSSVTKTNVAISMQNTTTLKLVSLSSAKQIYICSLALIASGATVFSIADGTKSSTECDTAAEAVIGAAVASHGLSLAANGGISFGSGNGTVARTITAAHDLCLFQSGSVDLSGVLTYVQQ